MNAIHDLVANLSKKLKRILCNFILIPTRINECQMTTNLMVGANKLISKVTRFTENC